MGGSSESEAQQHPCEPSHPLSQYSAVGAVIPTYDGNGNLTYDGTFTYGYDVESRLTSVEQGSSTVATYAYDAQGRRKTKTVGGATTVFVTDADNREVLEYDGATGAVQHWYAFGLGPDTVLSQMNVPAGTRATMIPDIQGSIVGTLDSGTAAVTKAGYQPYGENPANLTGTFRYTGRRLDPETGGNTAQPSGLYYYRARSYSPTWGRFLQPDPISYAADNNLYAYVGNDSLNRVDPLGFAKDAPNGGPVMTEPGVIPVYPVETMIMIATGGSMARVGLGLLGAALRQFLPNQASSRADVLASGDQLVGNNPVPGGSRVNTDLPGGLSEAQRVFSSLTRGQATTTIEVPSGATMIRAEDGTQLRINPDGGVRIDRPISVGGFSFETIHFSGP